jgi:hypothetical protein
MAAAVMVVMNGSNPRLALWLFGRQDFRTLNTWPT